MPPVSNPDGSEMPSDLFSGKARAPNGWMLVIEGEFAPGDALPSEAIRGAWAVDDHGRPIGRFQSNPRFRGPRIGLPSRLGKPSNSD